MANPVDGLGRKKLKSKISEHTSINSLEPLLQRGLNLLVQPVLKLLIQIPFANGLIHKGGEG